MLFGEKRPPGTGKTFISVKIVQVLMNNKLLWSKTTDDDRHRPILMVCYTNHALDQFLEKCVEECKLTDGVVRVGGQSKSLKLNNFKLTTIKDRMRTGGWFRAIGPIKWQIRELRDQMDNLKAKLELKIQTRQCISAGLGVLHFQLLRKFMKDHEVKCFERVVNASHKSEPDSNHLMLEWLGFFDYAIEKDLAQKMDELMKNAANQQAGKYQFMTLSRLSKNHLKEFITKKNNGLRFIGKK